MTFPRTVSWAIAHAVYFPFLCLACLLSIIYGRPTALIMKPRTGQANYICSRDIKKNKTEGKKSGDFLGKKSIEISGYSFVGWGILSVDDPYVIHHEFEHVSQWLGGYSGSKLAFSLVPLMVAGIFLTPLLGMGEMSLVLSLLLVLTFSLMAFVKIFH